ncbi:MAG: Minf_1886 family protein [Candidatus Omnitrophota bacterium]
MKQEIDNLIELICLEDPRYHEDAYDFILEALSFSQKKYRRAKHVTGKQMLEGVKELVMKRFGPMGRSVLKYWGINGTEDVGHIVFNLIKKKVLTKSEEDCLEDFKDVYDFERVFEHIYRKRLDKKISRMR